MISQKDAKVFLKYLEHCRTSCDDKNPTNWYTTDGRGGHPRCDRCMILKAIADKKFADTLEVVGIEAVQPSEDGLDDPDHWKDEKE
jgi:hypothetical protein